MLIAGDNWIIYEDEKRRDERFMSHAPVVFSIFSSRFHCEYSSMTLNHSDGGMCIESAEQIKPGTTLYIRRGKPNNVEGHTARWDHMRTSSLGEVRWCHELVDKFGTYYCIGVRYF